MSYAQHFVVHQKYPEALATRRPTPSPSNNGLATHAPTYWPTPSPSFAYDTASPTNSETNAIGPSASVISGHAFFDSDNNGMHDAGIGDKHISNVMVWLFSCGGKSSELVANAKTSSQGFFSFENLSPGNYLVAIQLPSGYVASTTIPSMTSDHEQSAHSSDIVESERRETICRSICFKIHEGKTSNIELSFGMQLAPTVSPSPPPSGQPTDNPSASSMPSDKPSIRPSNSFWPSAIPTTAPSLSMLPSSGMPTSSLPSVPPTDSPSKSHQPSFEPSQYPTRNGQTEGLMQTNGLRITLLGIDKVQNEAEWSDGMTLYINQYFNDEWHYAFDVGVDIILTKQTAKIISLSDDDSNANTQHRQLDINLAVEIVYNQINTYKTADPTFADVTYVIQEPFATTVSRYEYISFLQLLSPNYANVSSVSPVTLPPQRVIHPNDGNASVGLRFGIFVFIGGIILVLLVQFAFIHRKRRTRNQDEQEKKHSERKKKDSERGDSDHSPNRSQEVHSSNPLRESFVTQRTYETKTSMTRSNCSEVVIDIIVPPGRVGCIIDSSARRGPYVCEIHNSSPLRDKLQVGDRILSVDDGDVRRMNAIDVSKLLGSKSENEERIITISREFFYDVSVDESRSGEARLDEEGEESKTVTSEDPPGIIW
mmetsp:Transcript_16084/g.34782  ORF Transcript_16084/g.34782 Transcript_16084/m.34782 type:complete len:653 (-) Transcript_16084:2037-3995(-)|eukprot:CAMPEP_0172326142 /NCGR_PEP_ID=MMETSP1058-20130122/55712_1 /TAXON_ID=83371 /ORGANISM="Detonula confervacea, Strain CCMP 353" /LENGTH=652 /DNA_ID=CAMNT_0013042849 /DNA_START=185 /DNA_END=2143 /DNA_ORIENTATION=+